MNSRISVKLAPVTVLGSLLISLLAPLVMASSAQAMTGKAFKNLNKIATANGFYLYHSVQNDTPIKVAVIDNGFRDYADEVGKTLPDNTVYHAGPIAVDPKTEESHGTAMAQILSGLVTIAAPKVNFELHLYSAYGYTNLKAAVDAVSKDNFDIVLYSQVWEYGGNSDGLGFINAVINKAAANGVIWINAAGNFGNSTYIAKVDKGTDDWAKLPGAPNGVPIRCEKNSNKKCQLRAVLSWNDFKNDSEEGTDKDLDFVLNDDAGKIIQTSALTQMKTIPAGTQGASLYPREIITAEIKPGLYYLRAKVRSTNFSKKTDELRITTSGDFTTMSNPTVGETLLNPADNENVITVGASDSDKSSYSKILGKPEIMTASQLFTAKNESVLGSSNSAAITAAAVTLLKAVKPNLTRSRVLSLLSNSGGHASPGAGSANIGLPLDVLQFQPTGDNCFELTRIQNAPYPLRDLMNHSSVTVVDSTYGPKIFVNDDPIYLDQNLSRQNQDDMVVMDNSGYEVLPRTAQEYLPVGSYEVVQIPQGAGLCAARGSSDDGSGETTHSSQAAVLKMPPLSEVK